MILLGGVVLIVTIPQSPQCGDSPFTQGGLRCVRNRICGGRALHTSEREFDESIGSAEGMSQGGWCIPPVRPVAMICIEKTTPSS